MKHMFYLVMTFLAVAAISAPAASAESKKEQAAAQAMLDAVHALGDGKRIASGDALQLASIYKEGTPERVQLGLTYNRAAGAYDDLINSLELIYDDKDLKNFDPKSLDVSNAQAQLAAYLAVISEELAEFSKANPTNSIAAHIHAQAKENEAFAALSRSIGVAKTSTPISFNMEASVAGSSATAEASTTAGGTAGGTGTSSNPYASLAESLFQNIGSIITSIHTIKTDDWKNVQDLLEATRWPDFQTLVDPTAQNSQASTQTGPSAAGQTGGSKGSVDKPKSTTLPQ